MPLAPDLPALPAVRAALAALIPRPVADPVLTELALVIAALLPLLLETIGNGDWGQLMINFESGEYRTVHIARTEKRGGRAGTRRAG